MYRTLFAMAMLTTASLAIELTLSIPDVVYLNDMYLWKERRADVDTMAFDPLQLNSLELAALDSVLSGVREDKLRVLVVDPKALTVGMHRGTRFALVQYSTEVYSGRGGIKLKTNYSFEMIKQILVAEFNPFFNRKMPTSAEVSNKCPIPFTKSGSFYPPKSGILKYSAEHPEYEILFVNRKVCKIWEVLAQPLPINQGLDPPSGTNPVLEVPADSASTRTDEAAKESFLKYFSNSANSGI